MINEMGAIFGNRTGSNLFSLMLMQQEKINKNVAIDKNAMGRVELLGMAINTPKGAEMAFNAALDRLQTAIGRSLVPLVIPALLGFANAINKLSDAAARHPNIARDLVYAAAGITAFFSIGGILLLGTASLMGFKLAIVGLGSVFAGLGATALFAIGWVAVIAAAVAGAYEVYVHWNEIKPKLISVWSEIVSWINSLLPSWTHLGVGGTASVGGLTAGSGGGLTFSAPPKTNSATANVNVHMDGRKVGSAVADFVFGSANGPHTSGADPDYGMMYRPTVQ